MAHNVNIISFIYCSGFYQKIGIPLRCSNLACSQSSAVASRVSEKIAEGVLRENSQKYMSDVSVLYLASHNNVLWVCSLLW